MYIVDTQAVQIQANNFNGRQNKRAVRRALAGMDGSNMVACMDAGAYNHDTACKEALKALRKELKQRGKI